jgi:Ras-related C3 botulinum toxin substrate 1
MSLKSMYSMKCVIVGDGAVGKTSMAICYFSNQFPEEEVPTVFDKFDTNIFWKNKTINLSTFDTSGESNYDRLRIMSYKEADVVMICYSIDNPTSFESVTVKWIPEIRDYCPNALVVLVATKLDVRGDEKTLKRMQENRQIPITQEMGIQLQQEIGAAGFGECSALRQQSLKNIFNLAIDSVFQRMFEPRNDCVIS